jgi:hypothetical protein
MSAKEINRRRTSKVYEVGTGEGSIEGERAKVTKRVREKWVVKSVRARSKENELRSGL